MCENCKHNHNKDSGFLKGALFGAALGAVLGVLFAPQEGSKTRKTLKTSGEKYFTEGKEAYTTIRGEVDPYIKSAEEILAPIVAELKTASEPARKELLEKVQKIIGEYKAS